MTIAKTAYGQRFLLAILLWPIASFTFAQAPKTDSVFMFSYFKGNGEDGLHLAYSVDGYKWKALNNDSSLLRPMVGNDKLMRDPCIIRGGDGRFHMVWTVSWKERGIGYAASADLLHWSQQQYLPVMEHEPAAQNAWAPEITYDPDEKTYAIYWATTIPGRFPATDSLGDYNHRLYYTATNDFKTFRKTALLYDKGFNVIDATIFKRGPQYIMVLKDETLRPVPQKNLHLAFSQSLTGGFSSPTPAITGNYWAEGPTVVKVGPRYLVYFDKYRDGKYGAVATTDFKNWEDVSDQISMPKGIRHGSIFKISAREFDAVSNGVVH